MTDAHPAWKKAISAEEFLSRDEPEVAYLEPNVLAPATITELFSPRGVGKTLYAYSVIVRLAGDGTRVLLLDRDNSRHEVRRRLRAWGATGLTTLKIMTREDAPRLRDTAAWRAFPIKDYDVIVLDSLDAATEGAGEKDSARPSFEFASLLDLARREDGPAVFVLGNTTKVGANGRGSGIIEDRADIVYEVRDATGFVPSGRRPWHEELPSGDRAEWAGRATRRRKQERIRLAFIPTKFRVGEEPAPFVVEIDMTSNVWTACDVTRDLEAEQQGAETRRAADVAAAVAALREEVTRRAAAGNPMLKDRDAEPYLRARGLSQTLARKIITEYDGRAWKIVTLTDARGRPRVLLPVEGDGGDAGGHGNNGWRASSNAA